jgi:hypothetical protein
MSKIIDAEDILTDARNCVECIFLAASDIGDETDPIQVVADIASTKITEAIALLDEYRADMGEGPEPAVPAAKPVPPAARTKRKGK